MSKDANRDKANNFNRRRFVKLAAQAALVLPAGSAILAACGDNTATPAGIAATTAQAATTASAATTAAGATTTAASTAGAAATAAAATTVEVTSLPPVELLYTYRAMPQKDTAIVQEELNKLLKAKINATIKLNPIDPGSFDQKLKLSYAAGEKLDLVFTAPYANDYYQGVSQGNLIPLDDLLAKYAPKTFASMNASTWNAARVNGKIYAIINQQIFVKPWGAIFRKDLAEKYKLDLSSLHKQDDIEPFLKQVKEGEGINPIVFDDAGGSILFRPELYNFDSLLDAALVGMKADDKDMKVINLAETAEYKEAAERARRWHEAGYYPKDAPSAADATAGFKAGKSAVIIHTDKPGGNIEYKARYGWDFVSVTFAKPWLTTAGTTATMTAITRTSANPERAMMLLELLNTDKEVYNLLCKGIENKHWVWVDKSKEVIGYANGLTAQTSGYNPNTDWMFGNQFNAYYINPEQVGAWEATSKLNKDAIPSLALGFAASTENIKTEIAQVSALVKQYNWPLQQGRLDPATGIPEFVSKMKASGMDKILSEVQNQLNAWKNANA